MKSVEAVVASLKGYIGEMIGKGEDTHVRLQFLLVTIALMAITAPARAEEFVGRASIIDADTIDIHGERIRILDIDAPESRQSCTDSGGQSWRCGQKAALALADWIAQQTVRCSSTKLDRYGRHLGHCSVASIDVAEWLADNGWAVPYRDCKCEVIRSASERARSARRGIWSSEFELPWDWRKSH